MNWRAGWVAILTAVIASPLLLHLVPPNSVYGIRTKATLASPALWYLVNEIWAVLALLGCIVFFVVDRSLASRGISMDARYHSGLLLIVGSILSSCVVAVVLGSYLSKGS